MCRHNRQKSACKQCRGTSICKHSRQKSACKECGGTSICKHNRHAHREASALANEIPEESVTFVKSFVFFALLV
jgi:PHP family Zn ribbon phosphoesterase